MAREIHEIISRNDRREARDRESFLRDVVTPIYEVIRKVVITLFGHCYLHFCLLYANFFLNYHCLVKKEARKNNRGKASHSAWRNYDDLNEYFW